MNMVIPDEGKLLLIYWAFGTDGSDLEDFFVDLFKNNITVVDASTLADFTISNFMGYATENVMRSDFGAPALVVHEGTINVTPAPTFTCTGGASQQAFGWIMWGVTSGKVIAGQNFDVPRTFVAGTTENLDPFTFRDKTYA